MFVEFIHVIDIKIQFFLILQLFNFAYFFGVDVVTHLKEFIIPKVELDIIPVVFPDS